MVDALLAIRGVMVATGVFLLGCAVWVDRSRDAPALRPFVLFVGVIGTLAVVDGVAAGDLTTLSIVWLTAFLAIPCAFTWFVVEYYGLSYLASAPRKAAFVAPAVVGVLGGAVLVLSPSAAGSMAGSGPTAPGVPSMLGFAGLAEQIGLYYAGGVMLIGVAVLARTVGEYDYLDEGLATALSFVAVWPWAAYVATPVIASQVPLDWVLGLTATGYVLSAAVVGLVVTRGNLFEAAPAAGTLGAATVLSELDDAVVVVDRRERVVKLNEAAAETFAVDPEAATNESLTDCVGVGLETLQASETVELTVPEGARFFEASVSPIVDRYDRQPGQAVVISDVTRERVRSQRLSVLNRVLRHNLRNEMTSIMGRAEMITDGDHEYTDSAETILSSADDLLSLSERARQVEQIMAGPSDVERDVSLVTLADRALDSYRDEHPDASLSVDIDDDLTLDVDSLTLSQVLDNLVENALVHNDAPTPVVTISAREADGRVHLSVVDNGPGLPEHERAVIDAEDETALEHGSGLGLWAVKWGVVRLGGELEFHDNEPTGTVATIQLPNHSEPDPNVRATAEAD